MEGRKEGDEHVKSREGEDAHDALSTCARSIRFIRMERGRATHNILPLRRLRSVSHTHQERSNDRSHVQVLCSARSVSTWSRKERRMRTNA
jgi:hypothetical protein